MRNAGWAFVGLAAGVAACVGAERTTPAPGDPAFDRLVDRVLEAHFARHPTTATALGIHTHDHRLEDYTTGAVAVEIRSLGAFAAELETVDPATLSADRRLDREFLIRVLDAALLDAEVIRPWATDPDSYSSGITAAAHVLIARAFAPPATRLEALLSRMADMPAALAEARTNLDRPPRVFTEVAIQQIDGNRAFFETAVAGAFRDVADRHLQDRLRSAVATVSQALADYKRWLETDLLPRSDGDFALGADAYRRRLEAEEMIDLSLDDLMTVARADLHRNLTAFAETARLIDPRRPPAAVLADLVVNHPPPERLLAATEAELDAIMDFIARRGIVTLPRASRVRVAETPPFLRALTTASMDTAGPFETVATESFYNMTLPDPAWPEDERQAFMEQWYYPAITNVSVHEVWPGHFLQFSAWRGLPSKARKAFGAPSTVDGWAHYAEALMIEEGFHGDDPRYRLAQLHDALLRNVRFIVGIALHTQGMSLAEAERMFVDQAYQPAPVARAEARRGTTDATYGYYTMGKLMILKLRDDYRAARGRRFSLREFHDRLIGYGPLPLPLIRQAMLGEVGPIF
jgi:uncharacterized protein (DUF885 family)